jgi:acyl-CoA synthetase (AMP-forming)/AMP-acid ligase II
MNMGDIVGEAARLYPAKPALFDGECGYIFRELEDLSTNFAVQVGDRIVFCEAKDALLTVTILGCLKAGAIYVPVDPKSPMNRLEFIFANVQRQFIVSSRAFDRVNHYIRSADRGSTRFSVPDRRDN